MFKDTHLITATACSYCYAGRLSINIVGVGYAAGFILTMGRGALGQGVADGVVGIGGGDGFAVFRFALRQQPVVGIVGVNGGVGFRT